MRNSLPDPPLGAHLDPPADRVDVRTDDVESDASSRDVGDEAGGRHARPEDQVERTRRRPPLPCRCRRAAACSRTALDVDAPAVVGHGDDDLRTELHGVQARATPARACPPPTVRPGSRSRGRRRCERGAAAGRPAAAARSGRARCRRPAPPSAPSCPSVRARSRAARCSESVMVETGTMRARMVRSCRSLSTRDRSRNSRHGPRLDAEPLRQHAADAEVGGGRFADEPDQLVQPGHRHHHRVGVRCDVFVGTAAARDRRPLLRRAERQRPRWQAAAGSITCSTSATSTSSGPDSAAGSAAALGAGSDVGLRLAG